MYHRLEPVRLVGSHVFRGRYPLSSPSTLSSHNSQGGRTTRPSVTKAKIYPKPLTDPGPRNLHFVLKEEPSGPTLDLNPCSSCLNKTVEVGYSFVGLGAHIWTGVEVPGNTNLCKRRNVSLVRLRDTNVRSLFSLVSDWLWWRRFPLLYHLHGESFFYLFRFGFIWCRLF